MLRRILLKGLCRIKNHKITKLRDFRHLILIMHKKCRKWTCLALRKMRGCLQNRLHKITILINYLCHFKILINHQNRVSASGDSRSPTRPSAPPRNFTCRKKSPPSSKGKSLAPSPLAHPIITSNTLTTRWIVAVTTWSTTRTSTTQRTQASPWAQSRTRSPSVWLSPRPRSSASPWGRTTRGRSRSRWWTTWAIRRASMAAR